MLTKGIYRLKAEYTDTNSRIRTKYTYIIVSRLVQQCKKGIKSMEKADKIYYDKKVAYLDYFERGEKIKNGGFVKWEVKNTNCRIQIHIRGLYATDTVQGEILLLSAGEMYAADVMQIRFGTGEYAGIWNGQALAGTAVSYEECDGIRIKISESRMLQVQWRERTPIVQPPTEEMPTEEMPIEEVPTEEVPIEEVAIKEIAIKEIAIEEEPRPGETRMEEKISQPTDEKGVVPEKEFRPERISSDKWEQLNKIYPHIHPFGDSREYLSIRPRDFIILSKKYQNLVQNSFLLHGYYNYGHVILTRIKERDDEIFYLGVPGVYYDREKQAALMFGFEGFESGCEYASDGGFGYYMKRVDI